MAEFKTAEQYVVAKLEEVEAERDHAEMVHRMDKSEWEACRDRMSEELTEAYKLLNFLRDFITVGHTSYFGDYISMDHIYSREHPEEVAKLMEYYDMRPQEEE